MTVRTLAVGLAGVALAIVMPASGVLADSITLTEDTPIYASPADAEPYATMPIGSVVDVVECINEGFCRISTLQVPGGVWAVANSLPLGDVRLPAEEREPQPDTAKVRDDVDLYDVPGGDGTVIGMLEKDSRVPFIQCQDDNWCQVGPGWVWGDFLDLSE